MSEGGNKPTQSNDLIRLAQVIRLTGWNKDYVKKLREAGALETRTLIPGGWLWYSRNQVESLIAPKGGKA